MPIYTIEEGCSTPDYSCNSTGKVIYPEFSVNNADPEYTEEVMCKFATINYKDVMTSKLGIEFCCPIDHFDTNLKYQILKMDLLDYSKKYCLSI